MRRIAGLPRTWLTLAALLGLVGLFVLDGPAAGVACFAALAAFIVFCFRAVAGERVEDRTLGTGLFSHWF